jgi:endonuclease VIII
MPEGDSLHRAAARLQPLVGQRLAASSPHPRGQLTGVAAAVDGRVLEVVEAIGKNLLLRFEGGVTVRSHLRMNGRWRVGAADAQRAGRPWLVLRAGDLEATQWNGPVLSLDPGAVRRLGPDLLGDAVDPLDLVPRLRRADPALRLGEALQDQSLVAGIGNMWMSELLWATRLSPWLRLGDTRDDELLEALSWGRSAMRAAVAGARTRHAVYRRAGRPCPRCSGLVRSRGQGDANRTAYWCPDCQRAVTSSADAGSPSGDPASRETPEAGASFIFGAAAGSPSGDPAARDNP